MDWIFEDPSGSGGFGLLFRLVRECGGERFLGHVAQWFLSETFLAARCRVVSGMFK